MREAIYSDGSNFEGKMDGVIPPYPQRHLRNKYEVHGKIYHNNLASYIHTEINDTNKAEK